MLQNWSHTVWMMRFREKTNKRIESHNDVKAYEMDLRTSLLRNSPCIIVLLQKTDFWQIVIILTFLITKLACPLFYGFYSLFYYY